MKKKISFKERLKSMAVQDLAFTEGIKKDIEQMTEDDRLINACKILEKPPTNRTNFDILLLLNLTKDMIFFQENCDSITHQMCCKQMFYIYGKKEQILFEVGQKGTQFYIILKGTVSVLIKIGQDTNLQEVCQLGEGKYFGELALMNDNALRSATVKLKTDCHFACLDKDTYQSILMVKQYQDLRDNILIFLQIPYFNAWGERDLIRILYQRTPKTYSYNQIVYTQGDGSDSGVYLIKTGLFKVQMEVCYNRENLDQGELYKQLQDPHGQKHDKVFKTIELSILPSGHSFGEEETFYGIPRRSTVRCDSQAGQVYVLSKNELKKRVFWDHVLVGNLKMHIQMRQEHQAKMIERQGNIIKNSQKETIYFQSKKYLQQQELKNIDKQDLEQNEISYPYINSIQTQLDINIKDSNNNFSNSKNKNKIFKLQETFNISSKQDKVLTLDFVAFNRPQLCAFTQSRKSVNKQLSNAQSFYIKGPPSRKLSYYTPEKKSLQLMKHCESDKNYEQTEDTDANLKQVIGQMIQKMKDKINGRIIKSQFVTVDDSFKCQAFRFNKTNVDLPFLQQSKSQSSVDLKFQHFNSTIHKRTKTQDFNKIIQNKR